MKNNNTKGKPLNGKPSSDGKRNYLSQSDVPAFSLEQALRVPAALVENYGGGPATSVQLAQALNMSPSSGSFRALTGSSIAYSLTKGGYNASEIRIEKIADRIFRPQEEGDDLKAKVEAFMKPRIIKEFLTKYNGSPIPRADIALNVLNSMGVPKDKTQDVFRLILKDGESLGLITEIKGKQYVDLKGSDGKSVPVKNENVDFELAEGEGEGTNQKQVNNMVEKSDIHVHIDSVKKKRVYITHGKDMSFVEPIRKLLKFGEMEAVVSVEKQSVSKPVPDKVMTDMRSCGAAIIHVDAENQLLDKDAKEHIVLIPNVLIEIGAAMALFGRRFILLTKEGISLPSNLQGLYEVRYTGDQLSGDVTIKLLEAINDIKNQALPNE